jgi:4-hydroxy-3-methylbut-2-en-1-yl diphosphate reductase
MKLLLSRPRGFCAGVERAIDTVKRAIELFGAPVYVRHEIVHNRHVVQELRSLGAVFVEALSEVPEGARVIFSAHGVPPSVRVEAEQRNLITIDATCGLVTKVHSAAKRYAEKGYQIVLIGHRSHVETMGTAGEAPDVTTIVETVEEVSHLSYPSHEKIVYLTQTTLSLDDVREIVEALKKKYPQIETMPSSSICYATTNRQMALQQIAEQVDLVLVVGDPNSSNSNRLQEVAQRRGTAAYLVNCPREIDVRWCNSVSTIGMTAGASTPESIVQQCVLRLQELGVNEVEEVVYTVENIFFQLPKILLPF